MKLKKIIALACSLVMLASTAIVANAAVDGATATLEFVGYEAKGASTFAKVALKATIPDTLSAYNAVEPDWENTFDYTYEGKMFQGCGFEIPYIDGLVYTDGLSSVASYAQKKDNTADKKVIVYAANTGAYDTYYAGEIATIATLYYRITGDVNATYNLNLTSAAISLVDFASGSATPSKINYTTNDFAITNAVIKPVEESKPVVTVAENANAIVTVSQTGEVEKGTEITVSVKPMAGYEITAANDDALLGMGGEVVITVTEDIEIAVTAAKDDAKPAIVAAAFADEYTVTFFAKAPEAAVEYGIDMGTDIGIGSKLAAKSKSAAGFYGIKIHNLPEGSYNVSAYADGVNSAAYAYTK